MFRAKLKLSESGQMEYTEGEMTKLFILGPQTERKAKKPKAEAAAAEAPQS